MHRLYWAAAILAGAGGGLLWANTEDKKGIDIIVKKQPTGKAHLVKTDAGGNVQVPLEGAGIYTVSIFCPKPCPMKPGRYSTSWIVGGYNIKAPPKVAASDRLIGRPRKLFVMPEVPAAQIPGDGLLLYTEDIKAGIHDTGLQVNIVNAEPMLSVNALTFLTAEGAPNPQPQKFVINAAGAEAFTYTIETIYKKKSTDTAAPPAWLGLSSTQGSYPPPDRQPEITATVNARGLAAGLHQAEVRVCTTPTDEPTTCASLVASIVVKPAGTGPVLTLSRNGMLFTSLAGANADPETTRLCNQSTAAIPWRATVPQAQTQVLAVAPAQGTLAAGACVDVRVTPTTRTLPPGITRSEITIERAPPATGARVVANVRIHAFVAAPNCVANAVHPVILNSPTELVPGLAHGLAAVAVDNCGGLSERGVLEVDTGDGPEPMTPAAVAKAEDTARGAAQKAVAKGGGGDNFFWAVPVTADDDTGSGGGTVEVVVTGKNPKEPSQPSTQAVISGTKSGIKAQTRTAAAFAVSSPLANPSGPPVVAAGSAVKASAQRCSHCAVTSNTALSDAIEGLSLVINGRKAPLLWSSPTDVAFLVPGDAPPGRHTLMAETPDYLGVPDEFEVVTAQPNLYTWDGSGNGPAIVYNATRGGNVSAANPARAGDVLTVYVCGLGPADPPIPTGEPAPSDPISRAVNPVEVTIAGKAAEVLFAGPVPGYAGFGQINFKAPPGLTSPLAVEEEEIVVTVAGVTNAQSATTWFAKTRTRTAQVTVTANVTGPVAVFVDNVRTTLPRTFDWPIDSTHTLSVASPQNETATGRIVFSSWNGSTFTQSLSVKADANQTVTANFVEQFKLTANVTVPAGTPAAARPTVSLLPASADGFYNAGSVVRLTPSLSPTLRFNNWTGDATGSANPLTMTMTGAKTVTAVYAASTATPGPGPTPGGN